MPRSLGPRPLALRAARLALAVLCIAAGPALAADPSALNAAQREEIGGVVKDYLMTHPEVIQDAIAELERRHEEAQKTAQATALNEAREALLNSANGNVVGNPAGDVTLVEFFDYNCGYCKRAVTDLRALSKSDPKLRIVLRDLTIIGGAASEEASRVALAAKAQISGEKLFDLHTKLLQSPGRVDGARALAVARDSGLDMDRLQRDAKGPLVAAALQENAALGEKLALTGTPAFIIGNEVIPGAIGLEPLRQVVAETRRCGKATC